MNGHGALTRPLTLNAKAHFPGAWGNASFAMACSQALPDDYSFITNGSNFGASAWWMAKAKRYAQPQKAKSIA